MNNTLRFMLLTVAMMLFGFSARAFSINKEQTRAKAQSFLQKSNVKANAVFTEGEAETTRFINCGLTLPSSWREEYQHWTADTWTIMGDEYTGIDGIVVGTPPTDAMGHQWYEPEYELTNSDDDVQPNGNKVVWENHAAPFKDGGYYDYFAACCDDSGNRIGDFYIRRIFTFNTQTVPSKLYLSCSYDDSPVEYYINGTLVYEDHENGSWHDDCYEVELTPDQIALIHTDGTPNVLAAHASQNWGGYHLDCGLYDPSAISYEVIDESSVRVLHNLFEGDVVIPETITHNGLTYTVTELADGVFRDCSELTSVILPPTITRVGEDAFYGCGNLQYVKSYIPIYQGKETLIAAPVDATEFELPAGYSNIHCNAFKYSENLTKLILPRSLSNIGENAFAGCKNLTEIYAYSMSVPSTELNAFEGINKEAITVHVYESALNDYKQTWGENFNYITMPAPQPVTLTVNVDYPGSLRNLIEEAAAEKESSIYDVVGITVTGSISNDDMHLLSEMCTDVYALTTIDLGEANIENNMIGWKMFENRDRLTSIILPKSLQSISAYAFANTALTSIIIPDGVTEMGDRVMMSCRALTSVKIGNGVTSIPYCWAEHSENLEEVTIGKRVTSINWHAFYGGNIKHVYCYAKTPPAWDEAFYDGINPDAVLHVYSNLVSSYENAEGWKDFPTITGDLGTYQSYDIAVNVETMGTFSDALLAAMAEAGCEDKTDISRLTVTGNVNNDDLNFLRDKVGGTLDALDLRAVTVEDNYLGDGALSNCGFSEIILPNSIENIYWDVLSNCTNLKSIDIPSSVKYIDNGFCNDATSLETVTGGDGVTEINSCFQHCPSLKSPIILNNLLCRLPKNTVGAYEVPEHVTIIEGYAMQGIPGLTSITIHDGITSIPTGLAEGCENLEEVTIGKRVTRIEWRAFSGSSIKHVYCHAKTPPAWNDSFYDGINPDAVLHVYSNCINRYENTEGWKDFPTITGDLGTYQSYDIAVNVETVGAFSDALLAAMAETGCEDMADISRLTVTGNVNNDDLNFLRDNIGGTLDALNLGEVTVEGNYLSGNALSNCGFSELVLPNNIENIDWNVLINCTNLKSLDIPNSVNRIAGEFCYGATSLETVTGGDGVTEIWGSCFNSCPSLKSPVILNNFFLRLPENTVGAYEMPEHVTSITGNAMRDIPGLTSITIHDGITSIPGYLAEGCENLEEVTIGKRVNRIDWHAFSGSNIKHVYCYGKMPPAWEESFYGDINPDAVLHVYSNFVSRYENAEGWKDFPNITGDLGTYQSYDIAVNVETMGTFSEALLAAMAEAGCEDMADISRLTVTGNVNNDDLNFLRDKVGGTLDALDLGEVTMEDNYLSWDALNHCGFSELVLPNSIENIGGNVLSNCANLKSLDIPSSVKRIVYGLCDGATSLETVTGGDGVTEIEGSCFNSCPSLKSPVILNNFFLRLSQETVGAYEMPEHVTNIMGYAMQNVSGLTSITIHDGITSIPWGLAEGCENLEEVTIGKRVTRIEWHAFSGSNIKHVYCYGKMPPAWEESFYGDINPDAVLHVYSNFVSNYENAEGWKDFPTIIGDLGTYQTYDIAVDVETMGTFSEALLAAMDEAGCEDMADISRLTVTGNINNEDLSVLRDKVGGTLEVLNLGEVTVEDNYLNGNALGNCGFSELVLPNSIENIDWNVLYNCTRLKSLDIPSSVKRIAGDFCYGATSLETVTGGDGITEIWGSCFQNCPNLKSPVILNNFFCRLPENTVGAYEVPEHVTNITNNAMQGISGLTSITIHDGITSIPNCLAEGCENLEDVTIGKRVTRIEWHAFFGSNIKHVYCHAKTPPAWNESFYDGINPNAVLHVYSNFVSSYENAEGWKDFPTITGDLGTYQTYDIAVNVETMGTFNEALLAAMAEAGCEDKADISRLTVTGNINNDDLNVLRDKIGSTLEALDLGEVTVEDNDLGWNALSDCRFSEVVLPNSIEHIDWDVLANCTRLKSIDIPSSVKCIAGRFCNNATSLETVTGGDGVTDLYPCFQNCPSLKSPVILNNFFCRLPENTVGAYEVPEHVTSIAENSMANVSGLTSLTLPESITKISYYVFEGDENLTDIYFYAVELPYAEPYTFNDFDKANCTLHVYEEMVTVFQESEAWAGFNIMGDLGAMPDVIPMNEADYAALCEIYNNLNGDRWQTRWTINKNIQAPSRWKGVTFDEEGYVTSIDLRDNGLSGDISALTLAGLTRLTDLNLSLNAITGDVKPLVASLPAGCALDVKEQDFGYIGEYTLYELCQYGGLPGIAYYNSDNGTFASSLIGVEGECRFYHEGTDGGDYWDCCIYADGGTYNSNKFYWQSPVTVECSYPHRFTFTYKYEMGDANMDDALNVLDLQTTLNYSNNEHWGLFNFYAADTYGQDDDINVQDIVATVNILLAQEGNTPAAVKAAGMARTPDPSEASVTVENGQLVLYTTRPVAALDLHLDGIEPESLVWNIEDMGFVTATTAQGDGTHAIIYAMQPRQIEEGKTVLATFDASLAPRLASAILSDSKAQAISVGQNVASGIAGNNGGFVSHWSITDLSGSRIAEGCDTTEGDILKLAKGRRLKGVFILDMDGTRRKIIIQ